MEGGRTGVKVDCLGFVYGGGRWLCPFGKKIKKVDYITDGHKAKPSPLAFFRISFLSFPVFVGALLLPKQNHKRAFLVANNFLSLHNFVSFIPFNLILLDSKNYQPHIHIHTHPMCYILIVLVFTYATPRPPPKPKWRARLSPY